MKKAKELKTHYKLYKSGKIWVTALVLTSGIALTTVQATQTEAKSADARSSLVKKTRRTLADLPRPDFVPETGVKELHTDKMNVFVDAKSPVVYGYQFANGESIRASQTAKKTVLLDGEAFEPTVSVSSISETKVVYHVEIEGKASFDLVGTAKGTTFGYEVKNLVEQAGTVLHKIAFPGLSLATFDSAGAQYAGAKMNTATSGSTNGATGDTFGDLTNQKAGTANFMYAFVNNNKVAAGLWTNAAQDGADKSENNKVQLITAEQSGKKSTALHTNYFALRAQEDNSSALSQSLLPLPAWTVAFSGDTNEDGKVDWQDGAIAYRNVMHNPFGWQDVRRIVAQRIPMNFASQATNPFLATLDETKRIYAVTDGLGQTALLKGYQNEGHDSAHPDYDAIGARQGGAADMNTLIKEGHKLNTEFGVHINDTESYPEAKSFGPELVDVTKRGWDWLDPSYMIKQRPDAISGRRLARLKALKQVSPDLDFIYLDVWGNQGEAGWESRRMAAEINAQGWTLHNEFPNAMEYDSLWNHWSAEKAYGGTSLKGINSNIVRFIRNHQKDSWIITDNSLLGGAEFEAHEGWVGKTDFNSFVDVTYRTDLPTKFLQHFKITNWNAKWDNAKKDYVGSIGFDHEVVSDNANGTLSYTMGGKTLLKDQLTYNGGNRTHKMSYLLPWDSTDKVGNGVKQGTKDTDGLAFDKLYYWNDEAGTTNWKLTPEFAKAEKLYAYKLTDQGRQPAGQFDVSGGSVSLTLDAKTPYALYTSPQEGEDLNFGAGSNIKDPGFNAANTLGKNWRVDQGTPTIKTTDTGDHLLSMGAGASSVSQQLQGLKPGKYSLYVNSETNGREVNLSVTADGKKTTRTFSNSLVENYIQADNNHTTGYQEKNKSLMQKARVDFDVTNAASPVILNFRAAAGSGEVLLDDVRIVERKGDLQEGKKDADGNEVIVNQDFEDTNAVGLYPFFNGPADGVADPRDHLSEKNAPYTQYGWNGNKIDDTLAGNWSLKSHKQGAGLIYTTIPSSVPFEKGATYRIEFDYQTDGNNAFVPGIYDGKTFKKSTPLASTNGDQSASDKAKNHTKHFTMLTDEMPSSAVGFGIFNEAAGSYDFIMDNFKVTKIAKENIGNEELKDAEAKLQSVIDQAKSLDDTLYTEQSVQEVKRVVADAEKVLNNASHTLEELEKATADVSEAFKHLVRVEDTKILPQNRITPQNEFGNQSSGETIDKAFDGNPGTMWHTDWNLATTLDQRTVTMGLDRNYDINGFVYTPRASGQNGLVTEYEIWGYKDDKDTTGKLLASGKWAADNAVKTVDFDAQSLKKVVFKPIHTAGDVKDQFASAAEINLKVERKTPTAKTADLTVVRGKELGKQDWAKLLGYNDTVDADKPAYVKVTPGKVDTDKLGKVELLVELFNSAGMKVEQKVTVNVVEDENVMTNLKSEITAAMSKKDALNEKDYTPDSWQKLTQACVSAEEALKNATSREELEEALQTVNDAFDALVEVDQGGNGGNTDGNHNGGNNGGNTGNGNVGGNGNGNQAGGNDNQGNHKDDLANKNDAKPSRKPGKGNHSSKDSLPQAGEATNPTATVIGLGVLASIGAFFGFKKYRQK